VRMEVIEKMWLADFEVLRARRTARFALQTLYRREKTPAIPDRKVRMDGVLNRTWEAQNGSPGAHGLITSGFPVPAGQFRNCEKLNVISRLSHIQWQFIYHARVY